MNEQISRTRGGFIKKSLGLQTILLIAAITLLVAGSAAWLGSKLSQVFMREQLYADAARASSLLRLAIDKPMLVGNDEGTTAEFAYLAKKFPDINVSIASFQGGITYSTIAEDIKKNVDQAYSKPIAEVYKQALAGKTSEGDIVDYKGKQRYLLITPIKNEPGCHHCHGSSQPVLGAISLLQNMDSQMEGIIWGVALNIACGVLLALGIYIFIGKRVIKRVHALADTSERIIAGDFNARFKDSSIDELGRLAANLGNMLNELKKLGIAQSVLYGMSVPSYMCDESRKVTFVNSPLLKMLAINSSVKECLGMDVSMLLFGDMRPTPVFDNVVKEKKSVRGWEMSLTTRHGKNLIIILDAAPVYTLEGDFIGVFASLTDLTAIRSNENAIKEQGQKINIAAEKAEIFTDELTGAADTLAAQAAQTRAQALEQQKLTASASEAINEMGRVMEEVSQSASLAAENAKETKARAEQGHKQALSVFDVMESIEQSILNLKEQMEELDGKTVNIGQIMQVIRDIADQTNLLALNAAIEAARAGEVGRGFAVVADEVRKLAEKTTASVGEVGRTVNEIRQSAGENVHAVLAASEKVSQGVERVKETGEALESILKLAVSVSEEIHVIAIAIEQQAVSSEAVNRSTEKISQYSSLTLESMHTSEKSIQSILNISDNLKNVVSDMTGNNKKL